MHLPGIEGQGHRVIGNQPRRGPQADDAAERRGYPQGPAEIRAMGQGDHAGSNGGG